jgi:hypothetical protein
LSAENFVACIGASRAGGELSFNRRTNTIENSG